MKSRDEFLDGQFKAIEKAVNSAYKAANKAIQRQMTEYLKEYTPLQETLENSLKKGDITEKEYKQQIQQTVFRGKQWRQTKQEIAETLYEADKQATDDVNDRREEIYTKSRNLTSYETEKHYGRDLGIALYLASKKDIPAKRVVDKTKDIQYYRRMVQTTFTKYSYRGKTLTTIGKRAVKYITSRGSRSTGTSLKYFTWGMSDQAEWEQMLDLKAKGIDIQKQWIATLDGHTRMTHRTLDKQIQEVEDYFTVGADEIMFPRDPNAPLKETINCRCKMKKIFPRYRDLEENHERVENLRYIDEHGKQLPREKLPDMTYEEWEEYKQGYNEGEEDEDYE